MTTTDGGAAAALIDPGDLRGALAALQTDADVDEARVAELVGVVEQAVTDAYRRIAPNDMRARARVDLARGLVELTRTGDDGAPEPVTDAAADFARQAVQAARTAIATWLRESERERVVREGDARRGELVDAIVERPDGEVSPRQPVGWRLRAGSLPALLPAEEQVPGEPLERGAHLKVVVVETRRRGRDAVVVVSRTHPHLLRRLLEQEVPELGTGQVVIRAVARDPGRRSKVAVEAPGSGLDPVGACIGPRGVRHRAVVSELGEEQLHIVPWSADPSELVASSLRPATVLAVELDAQTRTARVLVGPDQLSLAIGRAGDNARLAARLTGWRIDIHAVGGPDP